MDLQALRAQVTSVLQAGRKIGGIIATMGTTDAFGVDDLRNIVALRDELVEEYSLPYRPNIHADAVIGWAWSVFNDYSFEANPLGFRPRTVRALAGICQHIRDLSLAIPSESIFINRDSRRIFQPDTRSTQSGS